MALAFVAQSTLQFGTSSCTVPAPTGAVAGNLGIAYAVYKIATNELATPSGWSRIGWWVISTGTADAANAGPIAIVAYSQVYAGTPGSCVITNSGATGQVMLAGGLAYSKATTDPAFWIDGAVGSDIDGGTSMTSTMDHLQGFAINDCLVSVGGLTSGLTTRTTDAAAVTGVTLGTKTAVESSAKDGTIGGNGNGLYEWASRYANATAGTQTALATQTATITAGGLGGGVLLRVSINPNPPAGAVILQGINRAGTY